MNNLQSETSPYLKQHATNPVQWYPWRNEGLELARQLDRPILLSIGYSTCHWCHVMARECFEDHDVAEVMNKLFINIKVDREERPDLDKIYQSAHAVLTRNNGGWPLTVFLNPQSHVPFFAGTYFPKRSRFGLPGFVDVLTRVSDAYRESKEKLPEHESRLLQSMDQLRRSHAGETTDMEELGKSTKRCRETLISIYDSEYGGFGQAPKFPQSTRIDWLLRHWYASRQQPLPDSEAVDIVLHSLTEMARGGIYDQLGGGFFRYSTDRQWSIPHFEKMLNDNGILLSLYARAFQITSEDLFKEVVQGTAGWILSEMQSSGGGLYSAQDADSEGEEGKYYVWRRNEVKRTLSEEEHLVVETLYGLDKPSNFENKWHLRRTDSWKSVARRLGMEHGHATNVRETARTKLKELREKRAKPMTDRKVLASWNGLTLKGLAEAAQALGNQEMLSAAQAVADFIRENMFDGERLRAVWCDGRSEFSGYLDDYAHVLDGLLTLMSVQWRDVDIKMARALGESMVKWFYDSKEGGFWFTPHDHERLIKKFKPLQDESVPAGNAVACITLSRLSCLTGEVRYFEIINKTVEWMGSVISQQEAVCTTAFRFLERMKSGSSHVVLRGPQDQVETWMAALSDEYRPATDIWGIPYEVSGYVPPYLPLPADETDLKPVAYVCKDYVCSLPIESLDELKASLS